MLTIDLGRLESARSLTIDAHVPADDPLFEGSGLSFADGVDVDLDASCAGSGEFVVRGRVSGILGQSCRRCLEKVRTDVDLEIGLVYRPSDELQEVEDPEVRVIDVGAPELDVGEAIREELILEVPRFALCDPECRGLCPRCGTDLNRETCDCVLEEADPRWDALRALNRK